MRRFLLTALLALLPFSAWADSNVPSLPTATSLTSALVYLANASAPDTKLGLSSTVFDISAGNLILKAGGVTNTALSSATITVNGQACILGSTCTVPAISSIATAAPITGGTITSSGTISCGTCVTSLSALANNSLMIGQALQASATITTGSNVLTALGVNVGTAGSFVVNGGALGTPSSGSLSNTSGLPGATGIAGAITVANIGGSAASHAVPVDVAGTSTWKVVPDCTDTGGNHLNFTQSTDAWSCGTSGGANNVTASGTLTSGGVVLGQGSKAVAVATDITFATGVLSLGTNTTELGAVKMFGGTSGNLTIEPAAAAGTNSVLVFPGASFDFSASGGTSQVVKQTTAGGAFSVARLACADLSDAGAGCSNAGSAATGAFVDGGTSVATVTGTGVISNGVEQINIGTGWATGTLTLPAISAITSPTTGCIRFSDGGNFVDGTHTLTITANAADKINGGSTGGSIGPFTAAGSGLVLCSSKSGTGSNWNVLVNTTYPSQTATGQLLNSTAATTSAWTATPTLGASGTVGTLSLGNATSGTVTLGTVTGALGTVTASLPANTGTIAELNLPQAWTKAQRGTPVTITISTLTFTPDFDSGNNFAMVLADSASNVLANPSTTPVAGQSGMFAITQSSAGTDAISTWGTDYFAVGGTSAITLSTGANVTDYIPYYVFDSTHIILGAVIKGPTH